MYYYQGKKDKKMFLLVQDRKKDNKLKMTMRPFHENKR